MLEPCVEYMVVDTRIFIFHLDNTWATNGRGMDSRVLAIGEQSATEWPVAEAESWLGLLECNLLFNEN